MSSLRVLFVAREYPPFEVGGVATHTFSLVKNLLEMGVECRVISFGDPRMSDEIVTFIEPKSSVISRQNRPLYEDVLIPYDIFRLTRAALKLAKREGFDILHVEEPYVGAFVSHAGKVTTIHDTSCGEIKSIMSSPASMANAKRAAFYTLMGFGLELVSIDTSRRIIVPYQHVKEEVLRLYRAPKDKVRVIRNGIEISEATLAPNREEEKRRLGLADGGLLVFAAAQHISRKRLDTLIHAVAMMRQEGLKGFRVVVAGDGPLHGSLDELVRRLGLADTVSLPGWVSRDKLEQYYRAADVFVLTSEYEAGPITLLEAMSYGTAVISTKIEGFAALLEDEQDALLFPVGDAKSLSKKLRRILNDNQLRRKLSERALEFASRFDWKSVAKETTKVYEEVIGWRA